jgi:hypothetical protein
MGEKSMKDGDFTRAGILGVKYVIGFWWSNMISIMAHSFYLKLFGPRFRYAQRKRTWYLVIAITQKYESAVSRISS